MERKTIVFDLDDTLVKEIEYLKSAFREIAAFVDPNDVSLFEKMLQWYYRKEDVFANLEQLFDRPLKDALRVIYRNHYPVFENNHVSEFLNQFKQKGHFLGMITDGYSVTQRNKLKALNIEDLFDLIIVSEEFGSTKPSEKNFAVFHQFDTKEYFYISDNVAKDFIAPNRLGWKTICLLDNGENIHKQDFSRDPEYLPAITIKDLKEIEEIIL